jgi:hypothetical protein
MARSSSCSMRSWGRSRRAACAGGSTSPSPPWAARPSCRRGTSRTARRSRRGSLRSGLKATRIRGMQADAANRPRCRANRRRTRGDVGCFLGVDGELPSLFGFEAQRRYNPIQWSQTKFVAAARSNPPNLLPIRCIRVLSCGISALPLGRAPNEKRSRGRPLLGRIDQLRAHRRPVPATSIRRIPGSTGPGS